MSKFERFTPEEFIKISGNDCVGKTKFIPPELGGEGFGYFIVEILSEDRIKMKNMWKKFFGEKR